MRYRKTGTTMSLLGGALLGASAMYLLDPQMGRRRRRYIARQAEGYIGNAGDVLQSGWEKVSDRAHNIRQTVAEKAEDYGQRLSDMAHAYRERLAQQAEEAGSEWVGTARGLRRHGRRLIGRYLGRAEGPAEVAGDVAEDISDYGNRLWKQVRGLGRKLGSREEDIAGEAGSAAGGQTSSAFAITLTAVGCGVLGMGVMYLMDPQRGRTRRVWLADKLASTFRRTGRSFRRRGRDVANRARGIAAETRSRYAPGGPISSEQLLQRVRSEMGRAISHPRLIQVMADANGTVTLSGYCLTNEAGPLVSTVESVPGVTLVVSRLEIKNSEQELNAAQSAWQHSVPQM